MQDKKKSKAQLLDEINELRREVAQMKTGVREREEFKVVLGRDALTLDSLAEVILYEDAEGRVLWANKAAVDTFGLTVEEMKGKTCYDLWRMRPEPSPKCPVREAVRTGNPALAEMWAPDGKYWNVRAYPVKDKKDRVVGAIEVALDITVQRQLQDELLKSEQRCRLLVEQASDAIFQLDPAGRITDANRAACDSLGRTREELLTMSVSQIDLDWQAERLSALLEGLAGGDIRTVEGTHLRKNGTTFPVEIRVTRIETDDAPIILALVRDITQRRRIESALIESEQALKSELEAGPTADSIHVSGIDIKWKLKDGTCTFDKLPVAMMWIESTLAGLISGAQSMVGTERFALALQSEGRKSVEDDWQVISQFPDFETGFKAIANIAAVAGWGDWNLVAIDKEKKECRFRVYNSWEGRCQKALGVSWGSALAAGKFAGYTSMLFKTNCWADQTSFLATGDEYDEFVVRPSERSVEREIEDLLKTDQATRADMAVALRELQREIEERTAAEKLLRESEERYRALVENIAYGITLVDAEHNIVMTNSAQGQLFQKDPAELVGAKCYNQFEQRGTICAHCPGAEAMKTHEPVEVEAEGVRTDGSAFPVRIRAFPLYDAKNNPTGFIEVVEDITERKRAEERLRESEEKYRDLYETAMVGLYRSRISDGKFIAANQAIADIMGYESAEQIMAEFYTPEHYADAERRSELLRQLNEQGTVDNFEITALRRDGSEVEVTISATLHPEKDYLEGAVVDITDRKRAEEALRQSEEKYRQLVERMAEGLGVADADYVFTYVNSAFAEMLGLTGEDMIGHHILEFIHPDSAEAMAEQIELRKKGAAKPYDVIWKAKDGSKVYTMASPQGFFDAKGNFIGSLGVITNITERKRTERELVRSREMLQNVLNTIPARVFWKDRNSAFLGCNKLFAHDAGRESPAELVGKTDYDMPWTKEESDLYIEHDRHVMESDTPEYHIIERQLQADGRHAWVDTSKVPIHDENGNVVGMLGTYEDITERKRTEEELVRSQLMLRNVLENIPVRVFWKDTNSVYLGCNRVFAQDAGVDMEDIVGKTDYELAWKRSEADLYREYDRRVMESDTPEYHVMEPRLHADGTAAWVDTNKVPLHDAEGKVIGILGTYEDITVRKRTQEQLEASQEQLSLAFEAATDGLWDLHLDTDEAYFSPRYYRMLGYEPSEFEPSYDAWAELIHPEDRQAVEGELQECIQQKADAFEAEFRMRMKSGGYRWVLSRGKVVRRDEEGRPLRIVGTHVDITERKEAEEERSRLLKALAAKNEELESIVYVSSHDLRSPLVNIQGFSGELHRSCHQLVSVLEDAKVEGRHKTEIARIIDEEIPASLGYISNSTTKMDVLLRGLLKLSRLGSVALKIRRLNMNSVLREVVRSMQYQTKRSGTRISVGMLPPCTGDAAQVGHVFANLLDNAIKYRHPERPPRIKVSGGVENGTCVYSVKDNGIGIAPAHVDKVFEIFHRLDPHSEVAGEGLGLTIVRRILDLMDGSIRVESEPGKGSTFYVMLPAAKEEQ